MVFVVISENGFPDPLTILLIPIPRLMIPDPSAVSPDPTQFFAIDPWSHIPCYDPAIALDWQNNSFARASRYFVHWSSLFLCRRCTTMYNVKGLISRFVEDVNEDKDFLFLFLNFDTVLDFNSRLKMCQHLTNWTRWNKLDKVWSSATVPFKWRFRSRRSS